MYKAVVETHLDIIDCILKHKPEVLVRKDQYGNIPSILIMQNQYHFTQEQNNAADRVLKKDSFQISLYKVRTTPIENIRSLALNIHTMSHIELCRYIFSAPTSILLSFILLVYTIQYNSSLIKDFMPKDLPLYDESKLNLFIEMIRENANDLVKDSIVQSKIAIQDKVYVVRGIISFIEGVISKCDESERDQHMGLIERLLILSKTDTYNIQENILYPQIYSLLIKYKKDDALHHPYNKQNTERIIDYFTEHHYIHGAIPLLRELTSYCLTKCKESEEILKKLSDFYSNNPSIIIDPEIKNRLLNAIKETDTSRRGEKRTSNIKAEVVVKVEIVDTNNNYPSSSNISDISTQRYGTELNVPHDIPYQKHC